MNSSSFHPFTDHLKSQFDAITLLEGGFPLAAKRAVLASGAHYLELVATSVGLGNPEAVAIKQARLLLNLTSYQIPQGGTEPETFSLRSYSL